jgi:hypothetical protein
MRRITTSLSAGMAAGPGEEGVEERARRKSFVVSADMAHAVHPNYADKHEPGHKPKFGAGVVVKHNANQRYATDAVSSYLFKEIGERAGLPVQEFVVRSDLGCGSTIGPTLSTNTGIRTVDVGAAQLSMHSVREMCGAKDVEHAVKHFTAVYERFTALDATLMVDGAIGNQCRPCGHPAEARETPTAAAATLFSHVQHHHADVVRREPAVLAPSTRRGAQLRRRRADVSRPRHLFQRECRGGVQRRQTELKGVAGGDRNRRVMGGETRRENSLRNGVHHADGVVWEPV